MPFGVKTRRDGATIDFDALYAHAIRPAAEGLGLAVRRADSLETRGVIHKAIFDAVLSADVMIADISLSAANAIYELGIRHTARPSGTIVMSCDDTVPFDIQIVHVLRYQIPSGGVDDASLTAISELLIDALRSALASAIDSPVHELFPALSVSLPITIPSRGPVGFLRTRLLDAQRLSALDALEEIRGIEEAIYREAHADRGLLEDVMLAYRDLSAWADMIRIASTFPPDLRNEPTVVQQLALALNRSGQSEAAESELVALVDRTGGDSETYGLLGRIYKDRWSATGDRRELDRAISAYRRGYELNRNDYYPGINLATLLNARGDAEAREELERVIPELRRLLDTSVASGQADYWQVATSLELAVLAGDYSAAEAMLGPAVQRAASPWMLESTAHNLELLSSAREGADRPELRSIIDGLRDAQALGERV
jgi:Flp pilus assembly protein TadD